MIESYEYIFSFIGMILYTRVRTVYTTIETSHKAYMGSGWRKVAMTESEGVTVSSTEPTVSTLKTPVWLQKGKNLFDGNLELGGYDPYNNGKKLTASDNYRNVNPIQVESSTTYTLSIDGVAQKYIVFFYDGEGNFLSNTDVLTGTFTTPTNCKYFNFRCFAADFTSDFASLKVQVEQGSTATDYEEYVDKKIYVKTNNGVYEEFINADEVKNDYSLAERRIGTWIDGKPLYRKVLVFPNGTEIVTDTNGKIYNLSDFGINNVEEIHFVPPSYYMFNVNRIPFQFYDGNTFGIQVNPTQLMIICTYENIAVNKMVITLQYTKTTDVATTSLDEE